MANDLSSNPWKIDTASSTAVWDQPVYVKRFHWMEPTTDGHSVSVTDKNGKAVWPDFTALAGGDGMVYEHVVEGWVDGLIVPTLDSGTLLIIRA